MKPDVIMPFLSDFDFAELKDHFDKNNTYMGAQKLTSIIHEQINYLVEDLDASGVFEDSSNSSLHLVEVAEKIQKIECQLCTIQATLDRLDEMHEEGAKHIPTIVTTPDELEALAAKQELKDSDRVVVETSYDRAMRALR